MKTRFQSRLPLPLLGGLVAALAIALLTGCSGVSSGSPANPGSGQSTVTINPTSLAFGDVAVGGTKTISVTVANDANSAGSVSISQVSISGADFTLSSVPPLPLVLSPGQTASAAVTFSPTSEGSSTGTLSITSDASNTDITVPLSGNGLTAGQLGVSPATMDFGDVTVGNSANQTGTLTAGASDITVSSAAWNGQGYSVSGITFPVTVPAGQSVNYTVTFTPQAPGNAPGTISFVSDATNSPSTQTLTGNGVQASQHSVALSWDPSTSSVIGYNVYRGTQSGGPYPTKLTSSPQAGTSFTDTTVGSGTTYYYVATSVDSNNSESTYSNEATAAIP
ncbi:MAG: choice-of-anchor D domain-containing protein [Acidobacteriia bacterium]|nr:choice-of-anchor D domain-containing protein [Terriglobia bacterium]